MDDLSASLSVYCLRINSVAIFRGSSLLDAMLRRTLRCKSASIFSRYISWNRSEGEIFFFFVPVSLKLPTSYRQLRHLWLWGAPDNPFIVQDFHPVKDGLFVFECSPHVCVTATRSPAFCGQKCSRNNKPPLPDSHENTVRSSCDINERLRPDGLWIFFSPSFEEYQNVLFLFREFSGMEMKTCSLGIAVEIRDMCTLFSLSQTRTRPRCEEVSEFFFLLLLSFSKVKQKLREIIKRSCKLRLKSDVRLSELSGPTHRKEPLLFILWSPKMTDSKVPHFPQHLFISAQNSEKGVFKTFLAEGVTSQTPSCYFPYKNLYCLFPSALWSFQDACLVKSNHKHISIHALLYQIRQKFEFWWPCDRELCDDTPKT